MARHGAWRRFCIGWNRPSFILRALDGVIVQESGEALEGVDTQDDAMPFVAHGGSRSCASRHTAGAEVSQSRNSACHQGSTSGWRTTCFLALIASHGGNVRRRTVQKLRCKAVSAAKPALPSPTLRIELGLALRRVEAETDGCPIGARSIRRRFHGDIFFVRNTNRPSRIVLTFKRG